jgi:predicted MPP superfamily phosphohydrolase
VSTRPHPTEPRHLDDAAVRAQLEARLGAVHARQRLGIEGAHESRGRRLFHLENWYSAPSLIRTALKLTGLFGRGQRNALAIAVAEHRVEAAHLPPAFDGMRILHLTDLHIDMSAAMAHAIIARVREVDYDVCVLTGDYRFATAGPIEPTLEGMAALRAQLTGPVYAVLGNHDSVRMVPELEVMDIRVLMNEHVALRRGAAAVYLAGIDDAHYYGVDNIQGALAGVAADAYTVLLSHTPEIYRQAAHAGADLLLCGHTHGGQICLPGGIPVTLDARLPRRYGRGSWQHEQMVGYTSPGAGTSIVGVRLNCPPEITVHTLTRPQ